MRNRYILGIVIATLVLITNQVFIQYWLAQKSQDANVINRGGKQRMLSQRINLEFCKWSYGNGNPELIQELYLEWKAVHYAFLTGDDRLGIDPITDTETLILLNDLTDNVEKIGAHLDNRRKPTQPEMDAIDESQLDFLYTMNNAVGLLQADSERKLMMIIIIEIVLMLVSLTIILLEVRFIFMPIEKKLLESNSELEMKNEQLNASLSSIQMKNKELERFTYVAAHDLREPLVTVASFINLFESDYAAKLDNTGNEYLKHIKDSTERMNQLVLGLLHLSRLGRKREIIDVDLNKVLAEVQSDIAVLIRDSGTRLTIGEMPVLKGEEVEFRMVFQNLLSNAVKFRKSDSAHEVGISAEKESRGWKFSISDNGIGIAEKDHQKVFEIFHRLNPRNEFEGTGMGLALCKKVVDLYGGRIWIESQLGKGTTVCFTIPDVA